MEDLADNLNRAQGSPDKTGPKGKRHGIPSFVAMFIVVVLLIITGIRLGRSQQEVKMLNDEIQELNTIPNDQHVESDSVAPELESELIDIDFDEVDEVARELNEAGGVEL